MPSHIENSPNSLCEAMLLGMPCIATFAGGTGSMIKDRETGLVVQDGDPWALAGAVIELIENESMIKKISTNARNIALKRHNIKEVKNQVIGAYQEILKLECNK